MVFGINLEKMVVAEVEKIDEKLKATPEFIAAEGMLKSAVADLQSLEALITPADIANALNVLFPGKFSAAQVTTFEAAAANVVASLNQLKAVAVSLEQAL